MKTPGDRDPGSAGHTDEAEGALTPKQRAAAVNLARKLMGRHEGRLGVGHVTAEDLVQIAEMKLVETEHTGEAVLNKEGWMRTVIRREWISILRKPLSRGAADPEELLEQPTGDPDPEALLLDSESRRCALLQAHGLIATAGLTPKETQAVKTYFANDKHTAETARILRTNPGAVRTHLSRALTKLRSAALGGVLAPRGHHD